MKLYTKTSVRFEYFYLEWEMFQTEVAEEIKTHILLSVTFFQESWRLWDIVVKYCIAEQATDENTAHAHFMLDI
jgi:hypothetical protein